MAESNSLGPSPDRQPALTDTYFKHTRQIVTAHGDCVVEYAVFMRRPVTYAGRLAVAWLQSMCAHRKAEVIIDEPGFFTPRMVMHEWVASITTATPGGWACVGRWVMMPVMHAAKKNMWLRHFFRVVSGRRGDTIGQKVREEQTLKFV